MAFRPKILALANKITLEARTGIPNVPGDPEYRILAEVVTDEQADVALACKVRHSLTLDEIAKRAASRRRLQKSFCGSLQTRALSSLTRAPMTAATTTPCPAGFLA